MDLRRLPTSRKERIKLIEKVNGKMVKENKQEIAKLWRHYNCNKCSVSLGSCCARGRWRTNEPSTHFFVFDFRHSLFRSRTLNPSQNYLNYVQLTCALHRIEHRGRARESCVHACFCVWRNVICVQSAAWRMRNGHFTVLAHAKLKILMRRESVCAKENRVKERKTQGTRKTEEERHF